MEQKILNKSNEYKDGKRIYVQTVQEIRDKSDDYAQMSEYFKLLAQYEHMLEQASERHQIEALQREIKVTNDAIVLLQEYVRGYNDGTE